MNDLFPVSVQARVNSMQIGQRGLFYDYRLNLLILGHITETGLSGRVIHTGITQKDIDKGYYSMVAFGYTYDMWCMHDIEFVGKLINYTSVCEYINFLNTATNNFYAVELVENIIENGLPKEEIEEETVSITYDMIKRSIGWSRFCYVTGGNHYAINDYGDYDKNYTFDVKLSHAIELKLINGD